MAHESAGRFGWTLVDEVCADKIPRFQTLWTSLCIPVAPMSEAGPTRSQDNQCNSDMILIPSKLYTETIEKQGFFEKATLNAKQ